MKRGPALVGPRIKNLLPLSLVAREECGDVGPASALSLRQRHEPCTRR
jgi:hypothetical protein